MNKRLSIAEPVASELDKFLSLYRESIKSDNPRIQSIIDYSFRSDGKHVRPILLLLTAKACGEINKTTYLSAITIELLHSASLIHDDVVDESMLRRGKPSINAEFGNKVAVLAGDYFLSSALKISIVTGDIRILSEISSLGKNLAEGELNQLSLVKEIILSEEEYFSVINKKTASLISACTKLGASSVGASEEKILLFEKFGEYLGICFQLRDDIFDYFANDVGKPTGNDIREGKITLPLLYALKKTDSQEVKSMLNIIESADFTEKNISKLIEFAKKEGGIEYTYSKIAIYKQKAIDLIEQISDPDSRTSLMNAINYIVDRNI